MSRSAAAAQILRISAGELPVCSGYVPLCVPGGQLVSSGLDDQHELRRDPVGIGGAKLGDDSRKPCAHFLLVASRNDAAGMVLVGKLRRQIQERTAAIGRMPDPLRFQIAAPPAKRPGYQRLLFNAIPPGPEQPA
jgi:hypothetical protein